MRFSYSILYIPGTTLCIADALPHFPLCDISSSVPDIDAVIAATVAAVPLRDATIDNIRSAITTDTTLQQALRHYQAGWPDVKYLSPDALQFAHSRDHLNEFDGQVIYDARIIIPFVLRDKMLQALLGVHQGIVKMRERAHTSLWWPKLGDEIERIVSSCVTSAH